MSAHSRTDAAIRVIPELRQAHVERLPEMAPARTIALGTMYDLEASARGRPGVDVSRTNFLGALRQVATTTATTLEMPEPLWLRFLPRAVVLSLAWKIRGGRRRHVVYAIENNDLAALLGGRRPPRRGVVGIPAVALGLYVRFFVDRLAFGTESARRAYHSLPFVSAVPWVVIPALPAPSETPCVDAASIGLEVVFVGTLDHRKGADLLLEAWPLVERAVPGCKITLVGQGGLEPVARVWADRSPDSRVVVGMLARGEVAERLRHARVLVAPSRLDGRWREQVGLPIVEGLAEGCSIVTTEHTGLAPWLAGRGHGVVVEGDLLAERLAAEIVRLVTSPLDRRAVRNSLPGADGRVAADAWLHGEGAE